jgi:hypothetical protein
VKKMILALLTSAALAAGLSGCFAPAELDEGPAPTPPAAADAPVAEDAVGDTAEAPEVETPELTLGTLGGDGFVYDDGLKVVISAGEAYQPSEWAAYDEAPGYLRFVVTLQNDTAGVWDPSMFTTTLSSGGMEMSEVFDSEKLGESPYTPLLPGQSVSFSIAYGVLDEKDTVLSVSPDWDHESVLFTEDGKA